jgi:hypothetical protein
MRTPFYLVLLCLGLALLPACTDAEVPPSPEAAGHNTAVCIWDGIGIFANHEPKLDKWQASLAMGETVEVLDQTEKQEKGKTVTYLKVKQADTNKEGWVASYYVVPGGKAVAVYEAVDLYTRPALVAKANAQLEPFDVVAITAEKDDWVRVTGKRRKGDWIDQDKWVKNRGLSADEADLALATLVTRALKEKDTTKRLTKLKELHNNADLKTGKLYTLLDALVTEVEEGTIQPLDTSAIGQ